MELVLEPGRPQSIQGRLEKECRVYDLLDQLEMHYERVDHTAVETMEDCAIVDRLLAPAVLCKNLFLCNAKKTQFYLLMIGETKKFKTKDLSKQIGSSRLSFASADDMERFLDITPGAVSILGLMNDHENQVRLLVDADILEETYVGCHPCVNTASLRLRVDEVFQTFLHAVHHDYTVVHLEGE
jgi:Ala-tRNA(Pro) deacylase